MQRSVDLIREVCKTGQREGILRLRMLLSAVSGQQIQWIGLRYAARSTEA
jgi:hypothetical protein